MSELVANKIMSCEATKDRGINWMQLSHTTLWTSQGPTMTASGSDWDSPMLWFFWRNEYQSSVFFWVYNPKKIVSFSCDLSKTNDVFMWRWLPELPWNVLIEFPSRIRPTKRWRWRKKGSQNAWLQLRSSRKMEYKWNIIHKSSKWQNGRNFCVSLAK